MRAFAWVSVLAVLSGGCGAVAQQAAPARKPELVGGRCTYEGYAGEARIVRVEKTAQSTAQARETGGPGYEGYEVRFVFAAEKEITQAWAKDAIKKEHLLQLCNSWYPGEKYIQKYGIAKDKVFKCTLNVITSGTCTPVVFEWKDLNTTDYFETKH